MTTTEQTPLQKFIDRVGMYRELAVSFGLNTKGKAMRGLEVLAAYKDIDFAAMPDGPKQTKLLDQMLDELAAIAKEDTGEPILDLPENFRDDLPDDIHCPRCGREMVFVQYCIENKIFAVSTKCPDDACIDAEHEQRREERLTETVEERAQLLGKSPTVFDYVIERLFDEHFEGPACTLPTRDDTEGKRLFYGAYEKLQEIGGDAAALANDFENGLGYISAARERIFYEKGFMDALKLAGVGDRKIRQMNWESLLKKHFDLTLPAKAYQTTPEEVSAS